MLSEGILAPLWQEIAFRGALLTALLRIVRPGWAAVLLTGVAFVLAHDVRGLVVEGGQSFALRAIVTYLVWNYLACRLTIESRSLYPAILGHSLINICVTYRIYGPSL